ncbi:ABC transporter permease [Streptomyces avidinii]
MTGEHLARSLLQRPYLGLPHRQPRTLALTALVGGVLGVVSRRPWSPPVRRLRSAALTASGVLANFGGVPLAFAFIATVAASESLTQLADLTALG